MRSVFWNDQHAVIASARGERDTEPVDDARALRRKQSLIDAIILGLVQIAVAVDDLQLVETTSENAEDGGHTARQQERAPRKGRVTSLILAAERHHPYLNPRREIVRRAASVSS